MIPDPASAHQLVDLMRIPKRPPREPVWLTECDARFLAASTIQKIINDLDAAAQRRRAAYGPSTVNFTNTIAALQTELRWREPVQIGCFSAPGTT
jgi:hypothetical protein